MARKLADNVLKNCMEIWLSGGTLGEAAGAHGISQAGLGLAISNYCGKSIKDLRQQRLKNMKVEKVVESLVVVEKVDGRNVLEKKLPDEVLKSCLEIWQGGGTLREAARLHGVSATGLSVKVSNYCGVSVRTLKHERWVNIAEKILKDCLVVAKEGGGIPIRTVLEKMGCRNKFLLDYVVVKLGEMGFERKRVVYERQVVTPERMVKAADLFLRGRSLGEIAGELGLSINQVRYNLNEYKRRERVKLGSVRAAKNKEEWMAEGLRLAEKLNRVPLGREMPSRFKKHYTELRKELMAKGFVEDKGVYLKQHSRHSEAFLLDKLREVAAELGHTPSGPELDKRLDFSWGIYPYRFGSLRKAQEAAGLVPNKRGAQFGNRNMGPLKYKPEELIELMQEVAKELGKRPRITDMYIHKKINASQFTRHFGSYTNALVKAGLD